MRTREQNLDYIRENPDVPVLIVGGGVNGIGTFRELALQGVDVYLAEMKDFCSGASAASSHMAHGGIRYLENAEFRLVNEALHERNRMLLNAPHYVKPLPTTIPIFKMFSGMLNAPLKFLGMLDKPSERGLAVIKIGLMVYDAYTKDMRVMPTHEVLGKKESLRKWPKLHGDISYTATYYDGQIQQPERLCVEMLTDAEAVHDGAVAVNYLSASDASGDTVTLTDEETGETFVVRPQVVINAAGPWIDKANQNMENPTTYMGGNKGSHLVVHNPELYEATGGTNEFFFENVDGRIVLIFPFVEKDKLIIGTTDIPVEDPTGVTCTEEEIDYFLEMVERVFPTVKLSRDDIVFTFSGVRPLPASDADNPGQVTRDHQIKVIEAGNGTNFPILSLVGGKWTSFRAFAEETADESMERIGAHRKMSTADEPIGGGHGYPKDPAEQVKWVEGVAERTGLPKKRIETLFGRYGTRAETIAAYIAEKGADEPITDRPDYTKQEIMWIGENEKVVHMMDFLIRRSLVAFLGYYSYDLLTDVSNALGDALGWSDEKRQAEIEHTITRLKEDHLVEVQVPAAV